MSNFTPTPAQAAIIDFVAEHPDTNLMVDARAGAAKTSTIVMAAQAIPAEQRPLAVAFNKKIADELVTRLPPWFTCKTLNAVGHQAWATTTGKRLSVDTDKMYKLAKETIPSAETSKNEDLFITAMKLAQKAKGLGIVPIGAPFGARGVVEDKLVNWEEIGFVLGLDVGEDEVFHARNILLKSITRAFQGEIDFDDQIYMSVLFGGTYPKYPTVIVDESQDLSPLNHMQLRKLVGERLISVGDPYQAIYAFRGADANSMESLARMMGAHGQGTIGKGKFAQLSLSKSFRVPHAISKRQLSHVPDFGSMEWLGEGVVEQWPLQDTTQSPDSRMNNQWSLGEIPSKGFILCRNNAPLMKIAFALIKSRRPVKILGRDIGASLASTLLKATGKKEIPVDQCYDKLRAWRDKEFVKVGDSESKRDVINDRFESLEVLLDASDCDTNLRAAEFIKNLFSDKKSEDLVLSSGHRSKGLEEDWVMHLDPFRCPSKWAVKAARHGDDRALVQEMNLNYVIETRSKHTLVLANLDDCEEIGE